MNSLNLDEEKKIILQKFRNSLSDLIEEHHDDKFLLRWLRARDFDIQQAEKMLREDFRFRRKMKSDTVQKDYAPPEVFLKHMATSLLGFGNKGHLVRMWNMGSFDAKGYTRSMTCHDMMMSLIWLLESDRELLEENNRKTGNSVETVVYIADYSGLKLNQWWDKSVFRRCIQLASFYQDHYPESLYVLVGVNAPNTIVYFVNTLLKPFLAENVKNKIHLYASGDDSYKDELFPLVQKELIPAYIGGDRYEPEGDPMCHDLLNWTSKIPTSYYLSERDTLKTSDKKVQQKVVRERGIFEIEQEVNVSGMILSWQFQTKDHNIKFGLFFKRMSTINGRRKKDNENEMVELLPLESTDSHLVVETGEYICEKQGTYVLYFDNTYSWLRSKHLLYKVEVRQPEHIVQE